MSILSIMVIALFAWGGYLLPSVLSPFWTVIVLSSIFIGVTIYWIKFWKGSAE